MTGRLDALLAWLRARWPPRLVSRLHTKVDNLGRQLADLAERSGGDAYRAPVDQGTQILLGLKYRELATAGVILPFREVEFRNYSQAGEDGILHYLFSVIGTTDRRAVELCAGAGSECISANLILHHGWHALLVDGSEDNVRRGREFFAGHPDTRINGPLFARAWVDRASVDSLLLHHGFSGQVDLLTLDLDGVDYWIWEALTAISPRVVVIEYNATMSAESVTVPYRSDFRARWIPLQPAPGASREAAARVDLFSRYAVYHGASLPALVKLARRKGYRLVGVNSTGYNAFFLREDVGAGQFQEVGTGACINPNSAAHDSAAVAALSRLPWERV